MRFGMRDGLAGWHAAAHGAWCAAWVAFGLQRQIGAKFRRCHALLGAYLNRVGLPYSAVVYMTQNAPQSVTWLSIADAKRLGIEVSPLDPGLRVPKTPASTPARSPPTSPAATPPPWQGP